MLFRSQFLGSQAQLVQPGVRELHLALMALGPKYSAPARPARESVEQRCLADSCLTSQHKRPALPRPRLRYKLVQCFALTPPAMKATHPGRRVPRGSVREASPRRVRV